MADVQEQTADAATIQLTMETAPVVPMVPAVALPPMDFYFYTNEAGLQEINLFGYIKAVPLLGIDANYGEGVYGTPIPPTRGQEVVSLNNWGSYWKEQHDDQQEIDRAIHLMIPANKLVMSGTCPSILIHVEAIELNMYQWQVWMLPEGLSKNPEPQEDTYIEVERGSDDDSDDEEEVVVDTTGKVFYKDGRPVEDSGDSEEEEEEDEEEVEVTGAEWEGWPVGNMWNQQGMQPALYVDPYSQMMMGGYGTVEYEEVSGSSSDEDW